MKPSAMDRETFLDKVQRSGLVSPRELQAVRQRLPAVQDAPATARALVEARVLTRFQAKHLLAGRTSGFVLGQYHILDCIGRGGMGRVYKAMHHTMRRAVALKVLAPHLVKTEKARRLFKHEVRAAARLLHPNIVTAYDANKVGSRYFLVMEYVDGPDLGQLVRRRGPLPVSVASEVIRQVAVGLEYASGMGMLHRDIKPSNLMLSRGVPGAKEQAVHVKILDFGLARLQEAEDGALGGSDTVQTGVNTILGTPDYLSPEQARSLHGTDVRSDLYSLGCTFYFILTGKVPFPGGRSLDKLLRHLHEHPLPVEAHRPELANSVAPIVAKLLAKSPADRFQTPAELVEALAPYCSLGPVSGLALHRAVGEPRQPSASPPGGDSSAIELGNASATPAVAGSESTWPPDLAPTAYSEGLASMRLLAQANQARRARRAFLWAAGAAATLTGAAGLFLILR